MSESRQDDSGAGRVDSLRGLALGWTGAVQLSAHGAAIVCCGLVLVAVGQPIFSDDIWWHLALGAAYLRDGPWLAADPLLFTALAAPPPTSFLADAGLHLVWALSGFRGLRFFHLTLVIAILGLAWSCLRGAGRNRAAASVLTAVFAAFSAYRLVQLRPELGTVLATLLLYQLLLLGPASPRWRQVALSAVLMGVWANWHPGYPIGPLLVATAATGLLAASWLRPAALGRQDRRRAGRLVVALVLGVLATCIHPMGIEGYVKAFSVASGSESLAMVVDEWSAFEAFAWPRTSLPPSRLTWLGVWLLLLAVPLGALRAVWEWRKFEPTRCDGVDPVLVSLAVVGLVAMLSASRFAWLCIFPLGLAIRTLRPVLGKPLATLAIAIVGILLAPSFLHWGDWPMITRGLPRTLAGYRLPYAAGKYHATAVWFLKDAQLEGNLFGRYSDAGFQSFWLGPSIRTAMNGSLNTPAAALNAYFAIRERIGTPANPRFEDALDALGVDLFLGTGLPRPQRPGRPPSYSTSHLEATEGWLQVFRNLDSAVYLRRSERNAANLAKVAVYYASQGVPFDRSRGFEPADVMRRAPRWASLHGVSTPAMAPSSNRLRDAGRLGRMASGYLALGMYKESQAANDAALRLDPTDPLALARRVWLQLRPRRRVVPDRLASAVRSLRERAPHTPVATELLEVAEAVLAGKSVPRHRFWTLPVFSRSDARALLLSRQASEIRLD